MKGQPRSEPPGWCSKRSPENDLPSEGSLRPPWPFRRSAGYGRQLFGSVLYAGDPSLPAWDEVSCRTLAESARICASAMGAAVKLTSVNCK